MPGIWSREERMYEYEYEYEFYVLYLYLYGCTLHKSYTHEQQQY